VNVNENIPASQEAPLGQPLQAAQRRVVALTLDPSLSRALEELAQLNVTVVQVDSPETLVEQLFQSGPVIALLDANAVENKIEDLVDRLTSQFPDLRVIVAGHSLEQNLLATRIAQGNVFRFLHKPASAQRLKLFVDAASRPMDLVRAHPAAAVEAQRDTTPRPTAPPAGPQGPRSIAGLPLPAVLGAAAAVVAVAVALVLFSGNDEAPKPAVATAPKAATAPVVANADVEALIRSADQAFAAQRFAGREGASAGELYQRVLQAAPQDARARSGLTRSIDFALRGAEAAFTEGRYADAEATLASLQILAPGNSRLAFLGSQLQRERERTAADENRRMSVEARQEKLRATLQQANERLRRGALIEPDRDNALDLLGTALDLAPGDAEVRALRDRLGTRLIETATQKLDANDVSAARALLDAAGNLGNQNAAVTRLRSRADELHVAATTTPRETRPATAPTSVSDAETPVAATPPQAKAAPVTSPAPAPTTAAPNVPRTADGVRIYAASELTLLRKVEVAYPERALEQAIAGWADVELTITREGTVKDIKILDSQPRRIFDVNLQQALRRWRYKPVTENGAPIEARTRMRLRFTPEK
jgi:protein TonB